MAAFSPDHATLASRCLEAAVAARVVVVGDVMLDRYVSGTVHRVSPEAPVPVVRERRRRSAPGGAANVAAGIRALGAEVRVIGAVGDDRAGSALCRLLERRGIPAEGLLRVAGRPTTVKLRILARHQQVVRVDREDPSPLDDAAAGRLVEQARATLPSTDALVLQDYDKGALPPAVVEPLLDAARERGIPVVVDPKLRGFFGYPGATVFKPNRAEAASALGRESLPLDPAVLRALADRVGCRHLLVTLGSDGLCLLEHGSTEPRFVPSRAREVYDVSGAGDTVTAVLATALAGGLEIAGAAALANLAAGIAVSRLGARPVGRDALGEAARAAQHRPERRRKGR